MNETNRRFLVYTSAGDRNAVGLWTKGKRNFDLWVTYYGNKRPRRWTAADHWAARPGGKFQNLRKDWMNNAAVFRQYEAILVLDDDIVIDATGISRLFEFREEFELTLLQPAYLKGGKISHPVTRRRIGYTLRYTDFIEVSCALFSQDAIEAFLQDFDGSLIGWGIDFWYLHVLRRRPGFRAAVVDAVPCINPWDDKKGGEQEISRLQPLAERIAAWERVKAMHGIEEADTEAFSGGERSTLYQLLLGSHLTYLQRRLQLLLLEKQLKKQAH